MRYALPPCRFVDKAHAITHRRATLCMYLATLGSLGRPLFTNTCVFTQVNGRTPASSATSPVHEAARLWYTLESTPVKGHIRATGVVIGAGRRATSHGISSATQASDLTGAPSVPPPSHCCSISKPTNGPTQVRDRIRAMTAESHSLSQATFDDIACEYIGDARRVDPSFRSAIGMRRSVRSNRKMTAHMHIGIAVLRDSQ